MALPSASVPTVLREVAAVDAAGEELQQTVRAANIVSDGRPTDESAKSGSVLSFDPVADCRMEETVQPVPMVSVSKVAS